ncbi:MAG: hypothetical protein Q9217_001551 [Psora testacea]
MPGPTLIRQPPVDISKSSMENVLELTRLSDIEPDLFTNTSFMKEGSGGERAVEHGWDIPKEARETLAHLADHDKETKDNREAEGNGVESSGPFVARRLGISQSMPRDYSSVRNRIIDPTMPDDSPQPQSRRPQSWLKCRGSLSPAGGLQAHLSALAYMSDSWFIGTVSLIHGLSRFSHHVSSSAPYLRHVAKMEIANHNSNGGTTRGQDLGGKESVNTPLHQPKAGVGMMVSLDHTIYFHRPREVRADEWLFSEMESPWSGEGRGLVMQRIWNREGRLVASCVQEVGPGTGEAKAGRAVNGSEQIVRAATDGDISMSILDNMFTMYRGLGDLTIRLGQKKHTVVKVAWLAMKGSRKSLTR